MAAPRCARPIGWLFGLYLVFAGIERFLIEILRAKDDRFLGPFTMAQLTSVILIAIGVWLLLALANRGEARLRAPISTTAKAPAQSKTSTAA